MNFSLENSEVLQARDNIHNYEKSANYIHQGVNFLELSSCNLNDNVRDKAECDTVCNRVEEGHTYYCEEAGESNLEVRPVNVLKR